MTNNPYSPSTSDATVAICPRNSTDVSTVTLAKRVFLAWERLRVLYIALLGALTVLLAAPGVIHNGSQLFTFRGMIMLVEGAIVANMCYFAGPAIETYVRWLGYERYWVRWILFVGGTLLTAVLAIASIAGSLLPEQN